jgi:hypothetical protein
MEDLYHMHKQYKSTKKLVGGPLISGRKAESGLVKKGYSVPSHVFDDSSLVYGKQYEPSPPNNMKEILNNDHLKGQLHDRLLSDLKAEQKSENKA